MANMRIIDSEVRYELEVVFMQTLGRVGQLRGVCQIHPEDVLGTAAVVEIDSRLRRLHLCTQTKGFIIVVV